MTATFNHLTIVSEDQYALGRYYQGFFHMKPAVCSGPSRPLFPTQAGRAVRFKPTAY